MTLIPAEVAAYHLAASKEATRIYIAGLGPDPLALEWRQVTRMVRKKILLALIETNGLRDVYGALVKGGQHVLILRHIFAPPISQDQLKLISPLYQIGRAHV